MNLELSFIKDNINLINEDTERSWKLFYQRLKSEYRIKQEGKVTELLMYARIEPLNCLTEVPENYLKGASIKSYILPDTIERIEPHSFYDCKNLEFVDLQNNNILTSILAYSFSNCTNLKRLKLPKSLNVISMAAFLDCENIELIEYNGAKEDWKSKYSQYTGLLIRLKPGCKIICNDGEYTIKRVE